MIKNEHYQKTFRRPLSNFLLLVFTYFRMKVTILWNIEKIITHFSQNSNYIISEKLYIDLAHHADMRERE